MVRWVGDLNLPLTLTVLPGRVDVMVLQRRMFGEQAGSVSVVVRVNAAALTLVRFRPGLLPPGVVMLPQERVHFGPGVRDFELRFQIDALTRPVTDQRVTVDWEAFDGFHRGTLDLLLSVLIRRQEKLFEAPVVTPPGIPLGGRVSMLLANDGNGRFSGHMRATGGLSFQFRLVVAIRSADGRIGVVDQQTGSVFGTFEPGDRVFSWDRPIESEQARTFMQDFWPELLTANLSVSHAFEFKGPVGGLIDAVSDFMDLVSGLALFLPVLPGAPALAALIVAGSELRELVGVRVVGPGGLVGVLAAAGGAFIFGPSVILPVFVAGAAAGEALIRNRPACADERAFARAVFGDTLPFDRIRLTNLSGFGTRAFVCPNSDGQILLNLGNAFDTPTTSIFPNYPSPGQIFIHELTHAWQIAHDAFDARFLWRGIVDKVGESGEYRYGPPGPAFSAFGLEGQGRVGDEWFSGRASRATTTPIAGRSLAKPASQNDPYFRYIAENIRLGRP